MLETHLGTSVYETNGTVNNPDGTITRGTPWTISPGSLSGGFFAGVQWTRLMAGVGLTLDRISTSSDSPSAGAGTTASTTVATRFVLQPGVRVAVLRSRDERVELYGQLDFGYGQLIEGQNGATYPPNGTSYSLLYDIGPGVRYWLHPQFALGTVALVKGEFDHQSVVQGQGAAALTVTSWQLLTSVEVALVVTAAF